jgi:hypothetical protein
MAPSDYAEYDGSDHPKKKRQGCRKIIEKADMYGVPVSLTYKKEPHIKSFFGGFATILSRLTVIGFFGYQCKALLEQQYTLQSTIVKKDLTTDT